MWLKLAIYDIVLRCAGAAFITLYLKEALAVWRSMHFMGHFMMGAILLIGVVFPPRSPRKSAAAAQPVTANGDVSVPAGGSRPKDE